MRVVYGRRKGARSWQEHVDAIRSDEARQRGFTVDAHPKCPTLCYIREYVQGIRRGSYEYLKTAGREEVDEHPEQDVSPVCNGQAGDERLQRECFTEAGQSEHGRRQRGAR